MESLKNKTITKEQIKEAVEYVFKDLGSIIEKPTQRVIIGKRGCITRGWVDIYDFSHCGNKECPSCNRMIEALKDKF